MQETAASCVTRFSAVAASLLCTLKAPGLVTFTSKNGSKTSFILHPISVAHFLLPCRKCAF